MSETPENQSNSTGDAEVRVVFSESMTTSNVSIKRGRPIKPVENEKLKQLREKRRFYAQQWRQRETPEQKRKRLTLLKESIKRRRKLSSEVPEKPHSDVSLIQIEPENVQDEDLVVENLCYICLEVQFNESRTVKITPEITNDLKCVNLNIQFSDELPSLICTFCWNKIKEVIATVNQIEKASKFWMTFIQRSNEAKEAEAEREAQAKAQETAVVIESLSPETPQWGLVKDDDDSNDSDHWADAFESYDPPEPKRTQKRSKLDFSTVKWEQQMREIDISNVQKQTGQHLVKFLIPPDDDGTSNYYEYNWLCRQCNIGYETEQKVVEHAHSVHQITDKHVIHLKIIAHRTPKDTEHSYCPKCWAEFIEIDDLNEHRSSCYVPLSDQNFTNGFRRRMQCNKCLKQFSSRTTLRIHLETKCFATDETRNKYQQQCTCQDCGKTFKSVSGLSYHRKAFHEESRQLFYCDKCGKGLTTANSHQRHVLRCGPNRHKVEKKFQCTECMNFFPTRLVLKVHMTSQHGGTPGHPCRFCDKPFHAWSGRMKHETVHHTFAFPLRCKICEKEYFLLDDLRRHGENEHRAMSKNDFEDRILVRIPFADRQNKLNAALSRYECKQCAEAFPTPEKLVMHQNFNCTTQISNEIDSNQRYYCNNCENWFLLPERLKEHEMYFCEGSINDS